MVWLAVTIVVARVALSGWLRYAKRCRDRVPYINGPHGREYRVFPDPIAPRTLLDDCAIGVWLVAIGMIAFAFVP